MGGVRSETLVRKLSYIAETNSRVLGPSLYPCGIFSSQCGSLQLIFSISLKN